MLFKQTAKYSNEMPTKPILDPGEEVIFDVPNYGSGRGHVAAFYTHSDGTILYAVLPNNPRISKSYGYVSIIVPEKDLVSAPF